MKERIANLLICPGCLPDEVGLDLESKSDHRGDVSEGLLICPSCSAKYPIEEGIAFLFPPGSGSQPRAQSAYETEEALSSYLWSHFADLFGDPEASTAYEDWASLITPAGGLTLDAGCAVGRFAFEMASGSDFTIGMDLSKGFIGTARKLMAERALTFELPLEGRIRERVSFEIPASLDSDKVEFIAADVHAPPFRSGAFSCAASLNIIDKVLKPLDHLVELNRVCRREGAQLILSDPFSWSQDAARPEDWLGGLSSGEYPGRGLDNIASLLKGERGRISPPWKVEKRGSVWWKIRNHANRFELIRSCCLKAVR